MKPLHMFTLLRNLHRPPHFARREENSTPLFHLWLAFAGLLSFAFLLLYWQGIWAALLSADPTFLTVIIVLLFLACTFWAGMRAWKLEQEHQGLIAFEQSLSSGKVACEQWLAEHEPLWARLHFRALIAKGEHWREHNALNDLLAEKASAPHEMVWWVNGVLLKLGLLGKVIGFSIMAMQLGSMEAFDPSQTAAILKTLTGGLGIALLTTITGLTANILLGLQLIRLDRQADFITAKAIHIAEVSLPAVMAPLSSEQGQ